MVGGLAYSEHGRPSRQFLPQGDAVAHTLPLDELLASVATPALRGGYACDDDPISDILGHSKRWYSADNLDSHWWLFDFHGFIFCLVIVSIVSNLHRICFVSAKHLPSTQTAFGKHLRRIRQVAGSLFVCYFIITPSSFL